MMKESLGLWKPKVKALNLLGEDKLEKEYEVSLER